MSEKTNKFEAQLDNLIDTGELLSAAIQYKFYKDRVTPLLEKRLGKDGAQKYIDNLPDFREEYQSWYSESLLLVKQVLPDRVDDFSSYYAYSRARKEITNENYKIRDYLKGLTYGSHIDGSAAIPDFQQQLNIVRAAKDVLESTLIDLTSILQADLFDSELDSARALVKSGFFRAAGAICGVIIEKHLGHVCDIHKIVIGKRRPVISDFINKLKEDDVITVPTWRFIQHLADLRNICDHAREKDPSKEEVEDLITGTDRVLKTVF